MGDDYKLSDHRALELIKEHSERMANEPDEILRKAYLNTILRLCNQINFEDTTEAW